MLACMLQNLESIGCLGAESSALISPLSANQQTDRSADLTGTITTRMQANLGHTMTNGLSVDSDFKENG